MNLQEWRRLEALFHQATRAPPGARAALLQAATVGNAALRADVESLLRADADGTAELDRMVRAAFRSLGTTHSVLGQSRDGCPPGAADCPSQ